MDLSTTEGLISELFKQPVVWVAYALALEDQEVYDKLQTSERFQEDQHFAPEQHGFSVVNGWAKMLTTAGRINPGRKQHVDSRVHPDLFYAVGNTLTVLAVRELAENLPPHGVIPRQSMDGLLDAFEQVMAANGSTYAANVSWPSHEARVDDMMWRLQPVRADWFWKNVIGRLPDRTNTAAAVFEAIARRTPPHVHAAYAAPYHELCSERFF